RAPPGVADGSGRGDGARVAPQVRQRRRLIAQEDGQPGRRGAEGARRGEPQPAATAAARGSGEPRRGTGRVPRGDAVLHRMNGTESNRRRKQATHHFGGIWSQRATGFREGDLAFRGRAVEGQHVRRQAGEGLEVAGQRADVAAGHRSGEGRADAEGLGIAERLLDQAAVDREGPLLIEARSGPELGDGVQERHEATRREHRRRVVRGLAPRRQPDRRRAERRGHVREEPGELVLALDGDGRAVQRGDRPLRVRERDERVERADLRARRPGRLEHLCPQDPGGMHERLAAVEPELAGQLADRVVGDCEDDQLGLVEDRRRLDEGTDRRDQRAEPLPPRVVPGADRDHRPAGAMQRRPERGPDRPGADDPDERWLARLGALVRVAVAGLLGPVMSMPGRIQVDPLAAQLVEGDGIGRSRRAVAGIPAPGLHAVRGYPSTRRVYPAERFASVARPDPYGARASLGAGLPDYWRLAALGDRIDLERAPNTVKVLLENTLRHAGGGLISEAELETLAGWRPGAAVEAEIPFMPSRVLLQDFTGVPAI